MSDNESVLYTAVYDDKETALADLGAFESLHEADFVGRYDAAVIANEGGKPHVIKRADRPSVRVIPEVFGAGKLPRHDLHEAASRLEPGQAGLIVVGEPTVEKGFDKAVTRAATVVKKRFDATTDELAASLSGAAKR
jgi:hypothetical protein